MTTKPPNTWAVFVELPRRDDAAYGCTWVINAPWAHPVWPQYALHLYDLTTPMKGVAPTLKLPNATHEMLLFALNPSYPIGQGDSLLMPDGTPRALFHLQPPNYGYQFRAKNDAAARHRMQGIVDEILAGVVSPDTDWRRHWDAMMSDAVPLVETDVEGVMNLLDEAGKSGATVIIADPTIEDALKPKRGH